MQFFEYPIARLTVGLIIGILLANQNPLNLNNLIYSGPKIHLEQLIKTLNPKLIIADGSNYKSSVARWQNTCKKNSVRFHNTYEQGAFIFSIKN
ncbi:hypothetical protein N9K44_01915 [Flavobacteriaceae bacterium]|nr:hypothetical protein [Flavobacteriaceae bacterium]